MIKDINAITPEYMKHRIEEEAQQYKQEIERLHSIIKEVREYIENNKEYTTIKKATKVWQYGKVKFEETDEDILNEDMIKELLEILDKGNDKECVMKN